MNIEDRVLELERTVREKNNIIRLLKKVIEENGYDVDIGTEGLVSVIVTPNPSKRIDRSKYPLLRLDI